MELLFRRPFRQAQGIQAPQQSSIGPNPEERSCYSAILRFGCRCVG